MLEILTAGGLAILPILICSALGLAIVLERFWTLRHANVFPPGLSEEVWHWARVEQPDLAYVEKLSVGSPLGELFASALMIKDRPRELIKERMEDTGRHIVHWMERYLTTLGTIALIGPLLGLLGTVIGLIHMFMQVMSGGIADPSRMAGGIGEALICTAAGLIVAIPAYVLHRYFRARISTYIVEMEKQAAALLDVLTTTETHALGAHAPVQV